MNEPVGQANPRHLLYRWTQNGEAWACAAYDHGPMCRRCRPVTTAVAATLDLVQQGKLELWDRDREGWEFIPSERNV